ncbi:MAG: hypothetical protein NZL87_06395 [Thermomicrobium sp.]|nr:hypothetical protein [Thermomicrobium sp.]
MSSQNWVEFEVVTELPERLETVLLVAIVGQQNTGAQGGVITGDGSTGNGIGGGTNQSTGIDGGGNGSGLNQQNFAKVMQQVWVSRGRR